jgi:hypothetical protein
MSGGAVQGEMHRPPALSPCRLRKGDRGNSRYAKDSAGGGDAERRNQA